MVPIVEKTVHCHVSHLFKKSGLKLSIIINMYLTLGIDGHPDSEI